MFTKNKFHHLIAIIVAFTMLFSSTQPSVAMAQGGGDGIKRETNAESGRVSFIGPESGRVLSASRALGTFARPQDPALALANRYAPEFGVKNPARDLSQMKSARSDDGRVTVRYQQNYNGIPVMGGELIVNTNDRGDLYSMNGEVSPDLSLQTQPTIDSAQAVDAALQAVAKWYQKSPADFVASEPELWIYDESLLRPSTRPVELTWRMEVTAKDSGIPVRELVLVNAERGNISLHFNQVDNAWGETNTTNEVQQDVKPATVEPSEENMPLLAGVNRYVATTGNDTNDCSTPASPCLTIDYAIGKAGANDIIKVASGTYTNTTGNVVTINKSLTLSGGWNSTFTTQNGASIIDGGGVRNGILVNSAGSTVVVEYFVIQNSYTGNDSGGLYIFGANFTLRNSSVVNNRSANRGAGIFLINNASLTLLNSTISSNEANVSGGGIYAVNGTLTINNSTIVYNDTNNVGGGITMESGTASIKNSILAVNTATVSAPDCSGLISSSDHNIVGNTSGCTVSSGTGDQFNVNPLINASLTGILPLHTLQAGSPAINTGDNATCLSTDERRMPRSVGGVCDIGAYEYAPNGIMSINSGSGQVAIVGSPFASPLVVNVLDASLNPVSGLTVTFTAPASGASGVFSNTGNNVTTAITNDSGYATSSAFTANSISGAYTVAVNASGYSDPLSFSLTNNLAPANADFYVATTGSDSNTCTSSLAPCATVQAAVTKAANGNIILVSDGVYTGSNSYLLVVTKSLTISGGWNNSFTSQTGYSILDLQNTRRGIYIYKLSATVPTVVIDRLSVRNGYTQYSGSGIIAQDSTVTIANSSVLNNIGGGVQVSTSTVNINNTTIKGNSYSTGGGINVSGGTLNLNNSTIINNTGNKGGGIYSNGINTINIRNSLIAHNTAISLGPDCYKTNEYGGITLFDHSLISNTADCTLPFGTGNLVNIDPGTMVADPTGNYSFVGVSPTIDAGDNNTCLTKDQRGVSRPQGTACDIGSFERSGVSATTAYILSYSGTPQKTAIGTLFSSNLKTLILDEYGDGVSGKLVTFLAPASGASAVFSNNGTNVSTAVTDVSGIAASSNVSANSTSGSYTVQTSVSGLVNTVGFQLTNVDPALPTSIAVVSGSGQSTPLQKQFGQPLKVLVKNGLGDPVPGVTVTFTAPVSGASGVFVSTGNNAATSVTDLNGVAVSPLLTANNIFGNYVITATVNGLASSVSFQITNGVGIKTYTTYSSSTLPGTLLCDETQPNCTNGSNPHADGAHKYAIGTYTFYVSNFSRDSVDGNGLPLISTVQYCDPDYPCPYPNAFWSGTQMVYGSAYGFPLADDIVAHELTHGVTQYESNLFYYYQSGAISESFSDVWGEYYDQTNGQGNDAAGVKWVIGEDVSGYPIPSGFTVPALRSMSNPPALSDPDKMSSTYYYKGDGDSGGVHHNSGLNNKAVYLMVDGGTFNGKTVTLLGWEKTGAIYYEAQANLLSSGADYSDLYYALQQACANLVGQHGITAGNCVEVKDAIDAVEMNGQPATNFNADAPLCTEVGKGPNIVFADDLENGISNWTLTSSEGRWHYDSPFGPYVQSGLHSLYGDDYPPIASDATAQLVPIVIPANAYLHFAQAYDFEHYASDLDPNYYDGGVLEYSKNNGSNWVDAGSLMDYNGYKGKIYTDPDVVNPLKNRSAFVGTSHGYISTRLNLSSLSGQTVLFRWRMGLDDYGASWGWWVDNVKVYTCVTVRTISGNAGAAGVTLSYADGTAKTASSQADGSYSFTVPNGWSGTVTPSKVGYIFSPVNRSYTNVTVNQTAQNYTATLMYTISGNAGAEGVTLSYTDGTAKTVTSQADGSYSFTVPSNWNGTITPSHPCYTFDPLNRDYSNVMVNQTGQDYTETLNPLSGCSDIAVSIGEGVVDESKIKVNEEYSIPPSTDRRVNYTGVDNGPVVITNTTNLPFVVAERVAYLPSGSTTQTDYSEMMGMPVDELESVYWFPVYDNVSRNTALSFGNVGDVPTTIRITVGGVVWPTLYDLPAKASVRPRLTGINTGPVKVESVDGIPIIVSERFAYSPDGGKTWPGFSEMNGLPTLQLRSKYIFSWYNNNKLNTELRFANTSDSTTIIVRVTIGGVVRGNYTLEPNKDKRVSYAGLDSGPVIVESLTPLVNIIASERVTYIPSGTTQVTYSELMGIPYDQLESVYWFPVYDNVSRNTALSFGNVGTEPTTIRITIGGVEWPTTYDLLPNQSVRPRLDGVNAGPVKVESSGGVPIIVSERFAYTPNGGQTWTSFAEMNGLPDSRLSTAYLFSWYNNVKLNTQVRFAVP